MLRRIYFRTRPQWTTVTRKRIHHQRERFFSAIEDASIGGSNSSSSSHLPIKATCRFPLAAAHCTRNSSHTRSTTITTLSAFHHVRKSYFSAAALNEDHEDNDSEAATTARTTTATNVTRHYNLDDMDDLQIVALFRRWFYYNHGIHRNDLPPAFVYEHLENLPLTHNDVPHGIRHQTVTQWWTTTFTDPTTGQTFEAAANVPNFPGVVRDGKAYYMKKRHATAAAILSFLEGKELDVRHDSSSKPATTTTTTLPTSDHKKRDSSTVVSEALPQAMPFQNSLHNPRSWLQDKYRPLKVFPTAADNFCIVKHNFCGEEGVGGGKGGTWWTASFQCPVTFQLYESLDMEQVSSETKMDHGGRTWYRTKSNATHAASANTLQSIDWDRLANEVETSSTTTTPASASDGNSFVPFKDQRLSEFESVVQPLTHWFREEHSMVIDVAEMESYFVATCRPGPARQQLWTASFISPVSGERFDSGTINDVSSTRIEEGVWYKQKQAAMHAAALRAYDLLSFRNTGRVSPRFCREDPSTTNSISEIPFTVNADRTDKIEVESDTFHPLEEIKKTVDESISTVKAGPEEEEDEDEFVIEMVPQQTQFGQTIRVGTLDIIAETWLESTKMSIFEDGEDTRMDNLEERVIQRRKAVERASKWLREQDQRPKQSSSSDRTNIDIGRRLNDFQIANVILSSLAEAHQRVPFDSRPVGVEKTAEAVLKNMLNSEPYLPDANTFAYYINCLEGESPQSIADVAEKLVSDMKRRKDWGGRPLPKPTSSVYSTLLQVKALAGNVALDDFNDISPPTREMFLAGLSSFAQHAESFSCLRGMTYINQMEQLSQELAEPSLRPDTEVFNAAMRWSGGPLWSRRYSRALPWDAFSDIFKDGVHSDDSASQPGHAQAQEMEAWMDCLKERGLSPNIETFEGIIQAWVRCGTEHGLEQADKYGEVLLAGEVSGARIQTFFPILAGWTYSGSQKGPEKVDRWLTVIKAKFTKADSPKQFISLPFLSSFATQRQRQASLAAGPVGSHKEFHEMHGAGSDLVEKLAVVIDDFKDTTDFFLPSDVFVLTTHSFALAAMAADSKEALEQCQKGIEESQNLYEDLLVWLYRNQTEQTKYQLIHLLNGAPSIYDAALSTLKEQDRFYRESHERCDLNYPLLSVEEKIRKSREFLQYLHDVKEDTLDQKLDIGDSNAFPIDRALKDSMSETWSDYRSKALDILQDAADVSTLHKPDVVRLCFEIVNMDDFSVATKQVVDFLTELQKRGWVGDDKEMIQRTIELLQKNASAQDPEKRQLANPGSNRRSNSTSSSNNFGRDKDNEKSSSSSNARVPARPRRSLTRGSHSMSSKRPVKRVSRRPRPHRSAMSES